MFDSKRVKTAIATLVIAASAGHIMQYGFAAPTLMSTQVSAPAATAAQAEVAKNS